MMATCAMNIIKRQAMCCEYALVVQMLVDIIMNNNRLCSMGPLGTRLCGMSMRLCGMGMRPLGTRLCSVGMRPLGTRLCSVGMRPLGTRLCSVGMRPLGTVLTVLILELLFFYNAVNLLVNNTGL